MKYFRINDQNPITNKKEKKINFVEVYNKDISNQRNKDIVTYREIDKGLEDFYTSYDRYKATEKEINKQKLEDLLKSLLFSNGGLSRSKLFSESFFIMSDTEDAFV